LFNLDSSKEAGTSTSLKLTSCDYIASCEIPATGPQSGWPAFADWLSTYLDLASALAETKINYVKGITPYLRTVSGGRAFSEFAEFLGKPLAAFLSGAKVGEAWAKEGHIGIETVAAFGGELTKAAISSSIPEVAAVAAGICLPAAPVTFGLAPFACAATAAVSTYISSELIGGAVEYTIQHSDELVMERRREAEEQATECKNGDLLSCYSLSTSTQPFDPLAPIRLSP
jgi:hypothetical protein